jgi:ATP-dependent DNA ligase
VHLYSRPGRELLRHPGMAWLREIAWPFGSAVLDGEAVAGDGHEGIQSVFTERNRIDGDLAFLAFDLLEIDGQSVMREAWTHRRKRLEDLLDGRRVERIGLVPVTGDAPTLWEAWVGMGGEGIVLMDRDFIYRPGMRSPAWLTLKPKITVEAVVDRRVGDDSISRRFLANSDSNISTLSWTRWWAADYYVGTRSRLNGWNGTAQGR